MKQIIGGAVLTLAALVAAGCSPQPDPDAVQQWMTRQAAAATDARAQMTGLALKRSAVADRTVDELREQIRIDFDDPEPVRSVAFHCFGADAMDLTLYVETPAGSVGAAATDIRCADSPVTIDTGVSEPVEAMAVVAVDRDGVGAWAVVVE